MKLYNAISKKMFCKYSFQAEFFVLANNLRTNYCWFFSRKKKSELLALQSDFLSVIRLICLFF